MSKDHVQVELIPTNKPNNFIEVSVYYSKGGMNYFTYKTDPRGYWLSTRPVELEERDGFTSKKFMVMSGVKKFIGEAKRFSAKELDKHAANFRNIPEYEGMVQKALDDGGLTRKESPAAAEPVAV